MKRILAVGLLLGLAVAVLPVAAADSKELKAKKEALGELHEFIGQWNGSGGPDKIKPSPSDPIWKEKLEWGWRFKGEDAWLTLSVKEGKNFKSGELHYLPARKVYQLTLTDTKDRKSVFEGQIKNEVLTLQRQDPDSKEMQQITMNTAAEGARFVLRFARKPAGTTLLVKDYLVAATKEGLSLGPKEKKNICVVSGGVGTMSVSYKGETFYLCCSGCADAFKENPDKYVAEFKAKKGKN